jgi:hypothetical protein
MILMNKKTIAVAAVALGALLVFAALIGDVHAQSNVPAMFGSSGYGSTSFNCNPYAYQSNYFRTNIDPPQSNSAAQGCAEVYAPYNYEYADNSFNTEDSFNTNYAYTNSFNTNSFNTQTTNNYAGYNGLYTSSPYSFGGYGGYNYGYSYPSYYGSSYSLYAPYVSSNYPSSYFYWVG